MAYKKDYKNGSKSKSVTKGKKRAVRKSSAGKVAGGKSNSRSRIKGVGK